MSTRAAGFVIYRKLRDQFEYLVLQASYGTNHWTPPKGHVDPGEDLLETAYRETEEEAGLPKETLKVHENVFADLVYPVRGKTKTTTYWLAELADSTASVKLSDEHIAFDWLPLQLACERVKHKQMNDMLINFEEVLNKKQSN